MKWRDLACSEKGAKATEYAEMLALIIVDCNAAIAVLGNKVNNSFQKMANLMPEN